MILRLVIALSLLHFSAPAFAREVIRAVGSSTVYPFVTVAAEEFGDKTLYRTPVIESTGTGGGFKLFCQGVGPEYPDLANASRAIKKSEIELCHKNGVTDITEIKIGYDGIVLANAVGVQRFNLTEEQIFKALAKQVPVKGKLKDNPYKKWREIDRGLPDKKIEVYGPPPTSGTRDSFVEIVMEKGCEAFLEFKKAYPDDEQRKKACHMLREDGHFIDAGENDNLIIQKLRANPDALGIFGFSFLEENLDSVQGSLIDGAAPEFETIAEGTYAIARPLFVYVKKAHFGLIPGIEDFMRELTSEESVGEEGYLAMRGLIPIQPGERYLLRRKLGF